MNSGDWVETLSALVEDFDGNWSLLYYNQSSAIEKTPASKNGVSNIIEPFPRAEKQVAFSRDLIEKIQRIV
jgi:hypothetical protein